MWVKNDDNQYVNLENGLTLFVRRYHDRVDGVDGAELWRINSESPSYGTRAIRSGYATEEEALSALDELMGGHEELVEIQPPVTDEETADADGTQTTNASVEEAK